MTEDWRRWLDAASEEESPGASDWVTVTPTTPETTMSNVDFALCFRARFRLSQVTLGFPCTYIENSNGQVCGKPLDSGAWHAQDCARIPINERHNALGLDVRNMAREATLRANNEQRAVELPLDEPEEEGEERTQGGDRRDERISELKRWAAPPQPLLT